MPLIFDTHCADGPQYSCVVDAILVDIYNSTDCSSAGLQSPLFETGCDASNGTAAIVQCNKGMNLIFSTQSPTTQSPTTQHPTSQSPTTQSPTTQSPTTATLQPTQFPTPIYCTTHDLRNANVNCTIHCINIGNATQSCRNESIYAGAGTLVINCMFERYACQYASIYGGAGMLFVNCIGDYACSDVSIYGGTGELFIKCTGDAGCWSAVIYANGPISIDAQGDLSLAFASISCNTTTYCN
eukprot:487657_1